MGYKHKAEKIMQYEGQVIRAPYVEHYAPDTPAAVAWLSRRQPNLWRERQQVDVTARGTG
jgi:hypothetical protein